MKLKKNFSNHWLMVRLLNLRLDNIRNCEDAVPVVKEFDKIIKCKKKGILNLVHKQELLFKEFKDLKIGLKKCLRILE